MNAFVGRTIGEILADNKLDYSAVRLVDEPPGRLWGVEITLLEKGQSGRLFLELEHSNHLFSEARTWPQTLVEQQKVIKVHASRDLLF